MQKRTERRRNLAGRRWMLLLGWMAIGLCAGSWNSASVRPCFAEFVEPAGWEKARLGMLLDEFRSAYPKAQALDAEATPGPPGLVLRRFELAGQKFGKLRDCRLQFHFTGTPLRLFRIEGRCGESGEAVAQALRAAYGEPTRITNSALIWTGKEVEVNVNPRGGVFSINHIALSRNFIAALMGSMGKVPLGPTAAPSPAAP